MTGPDDTDDNTRAAGEIPAVEPDPPRPGPGDPTVLESSRRPGLFDAWRAPRFGPRAGAGAAWVLPPLTGVLCLLLERFGAFASMGAGWTAEEVGRVRFQALQSVCFGFGWLAYFVAVGWLLDFLHPIAVLNVIAAALRPLLVGAGLVAGVPVWARALWCAFRGTQWELPGNGSWIAVASRRLTPSRPPPRPGGPLAAP